MPNRIIKDSIRTSKSVNGMTDFQFRLWVYLITYVDDYGRGSADPELLKGFVFPRRKGVTESTIEKALADLANSGSILLYDVDGESYFCFPNWGEHQRIQTKRSKFPAPSDGIIKNSTVGHGEPPPESNPIRTQNPNPNPNTNAHTRESEFEIFWNAYPRKAGSKQKAMAAFKKIGVPLQTLLQAIEKQKRSSQWTKDGGRFIPHPATWLNGSRWEDDLPEDKSILKGASGTLGTAELEAIQWILSEEMPEDVPDMEEKYESRY